MNWYYVFLIAALAEVLWESAVAARNSRKLLSKGAVEILPLILPLMALIYAGMFAGSFIEFGIRRPELTTLWITAFALLFILAKLLKFWAVQALGPFWTMKVLVIAGSQVIKSGPYRFFRHPNYVAVLMELAAIPLLGKNFRTAIASLAAFLLILIFRIRAEEAALRKMTNYSEHF